MRKNLLLATGLAWLALTGAASAAVMVTLNEGPADPQYFAPEAAGQNNFTLDDITWTLVSGAAGTQRERRLTSLPLPWEWRWPQWDNLYVRGGRRHGISDLGLASDQP